MPEAVRRPERWLLLIHAIPPKPDYFRVKVGRRLQRIGAVAIKNSVYVLPQRSDTYEDFEWLLREIVAGGGEASMCEASFVEGLSNADVERLFITARDADYEALSAEAERGEAALPPAGRIPTEQRAQAHRELARLRRRLGEVAAIDFFGAPRRASAEALLDRIEERLRATAEDAMPRGRMRASDLTGALHGRTWVTRRGVHVDRIASAWLIRRFIDPDARFKFVEPRGYTPAPGELRFDMFDAEYTHEGEHCTFETLLEHFALGDAALQAIGEIVHDIDMKDARFGRAETPGIAQLIVGIVLANDSDESRLERGAAMLDDLYGALQTAPTSTRPAPSRTRVRTEGTGRARGRRSR
jgi:hypothetical protein